MKPDPGITGKASVFRTTRWTLVLRAGRPDSPEGRAALSELCSIYWQPLYCCIRHKGHSPDDAKDLTQNFFERFLEKNKAAAADPKRGKFRAFLLRSMENFLKNEHEWRTAKKRGGAFQILSMNVESAENSYAAELAQGLSPADLFDLHWARSLLGEVMNQLRFEYTGGGREKLFQLLEPMLWRDPDSSTYAQIAKGLGQTTGSVKVAAHRLRQRYRDLLREHIAGTVETPEDMEEELRFLQKVLSRT